jgi:hypothetical protein
VAPPLTATFAPATSVLFLKTSNGAMNTSIRLMRPDLAKRFEAKIGMSCDEFFGEYSYVHKKSGRKVIEDMFPFHSYAFQEGLIHAEMSAATSRRCSTSAR